jgi:hypothetical protein
MILRIHWSKKCEINKPSSNNQDCGIIDKKEILQLVTSNHLSLAQNKVTNKSVNWEEDINKNPS